MCAALGGDDRLEGWLTRIAAEMAYYQTGEIAVMDNLSSSRPPGASHLAPDWAVERATDAAKALHKQAMRLKAETRFGPSTLPPPNMETVGQARRRRKKPASGSGGGAAANARTGAAASGAAARTTG